MLAAFMSPDSGMWVSQILNDCYLVRHYWRNQVRREQALQRLGLTLREALNNCDDHPRIIRALSEGLHPRDDPRF